MSASGAKLYMFRNLWLMAIFFAIAALHVGAWSVHPPDVDSINFTAALDHFDLSNDAPHPPGYPLYVGLGRVAQHIVGANHAYQLVNLAMLLGASILLIFIGSQFGSRHVGVIAGIVFAAHPLIWAATVVPECYVSDAFGGTALVACGLKVGRRPVRGLMLFIAIEFMIGMMRPTSCVLLLPAGLTAIWLSARAGEHWGRWIAIAIIGAATAAIAAYLSTAMLAGGFDVYSAQADRVMGAAFKSSSVLAGAPVQVHVAMVLRLVAWFALWCAPLLLALAACFMLGRIDGWLRIGLLIIAWIVPALGFYALIYYLKPAYQIIFQPPLCLGLGWAMVRIGGDRMTRITVVMAALLVAQLSFFWFGSKRLPQQLYHLTHRSFESRDAAWSRLEPIVARVPADQLVLYRDQPDVPVQALRLMRSDGFFAAQDVDGHITFNDNGKWLHATQENLSRYKSTLIVTSKDGGGADTMLAGPPLSLAKKDSSAAPSDIGAARVVRSSPRVR